MCRPVCVGSHEVEEFRGPWGRFHSKSSPPSRKGRRRRFGVVRLSPTVSGVKRDDMLTSSVYQRSPTTSKREGVDSFRVKDPVQWSEETTSLVVGK